RPLGGRHRRVPDRTSTARPVDRPSRRAPRDRAPGGGRRARLPTGGVSARRASVSWSRDDRARALAARALAGRPSDGGRARDRARHLHGSRGRPLPESPRRQRRLDLRGARADRADGRYWQRHGSVRVQRVPDGHWSAVETGRVVADVARVELAVTADGRREAGRAIARAILEPAIRGGGAGVPIERSGVGGKWLALLDRAGTVARLGTLDDAVAAHRGSREG